MAHLFLSKIWDLCDRQQIVGLSGKKKDADDESRWVSIFWIRDIIIETRRDVKTRMRIQGFGVQKHGVCLMRLCPSENTLWIGWEKMQIGACSQKAQPLASKTRASLMMNGILLGLSDGRTVDGIDSNQEKIWWSVNCCVSGREQERNGNIFKDRKEGNIHKMRKGRGVADRDYCGLEWIPC